MYVRPAILIKQTSTVLNFSTIRFGSNPGMGELFQNLFCVKVFPDTLSLPICDGKPYLQCVQPFVIKLCLQKCLTEGPIKKRLNSKRARLLLLHFLVSKAKSFGADVTPVKVDTLDKLKEVMLSGEKFYRVISGSCQIVGA